jgi:hypothetical protein
MLFSKNSAGPRRMRQHARASIMLAGVVLGSTSLGALTLGSGAAGAARTATSTTATSTVVLDFYQVQSSLTFYNAADIAIQGYPPVGGHVREDDIDYVGNHAHHAKKVSVSDHLFCSVISAPANATCAFEFAVGGSLIYGDNLHGNLASSNDTLLVTGGTGKYAGYTGTAVGTPIGNSNNSDIVITLHK